MLEQLTPNLMVDSVDDTVDYYKDTLGFELTMSQPEERPFEWAMVKSGEVALMFQTRESLTGELPLFEGQAIGATLTFFTMTNDIDGLYSRLKDKAEMVLDMRTTFYGMREFYIRDCNGYVLAFAQRT